MMGPQQRKNDLEKGIEKLDHDLEDKLSDLKYAFAPKFTHLIGLAAVVFISRDRYAWRFRPDKGIYHYYTTNTLALAVRQSYIGAFIIFPAYWMTCSVCNLIYSGYKTPRIELRYERKVKKLNDRYLETERKLLEINK